MANRSPTIIDRADEVDTDLVPEPWDDRDAAEDQEIVTRRERYRLQGATDGQGAGIVPAYNLNVADTEAIPSKTKDGWTRGSAGRVLGPDGKYVSRGSDVPRKSFDGEEPGLLVEAAQRTNHVENSSAINDSNWASVNIVSEPTQSSILKGETAYSQTGDGNIFTRLVADAGTLTGGVEVASFILEKGSADKSGVRIGGAGGDAVVWVDYDWATDSTSVQSGTADEINVRTLSTSGPNRGKVVKIIVRYSGNAADNVDGDGRTAVIYVDRNGNGNSTICHHAQLEEAPNASSPIVTQGSPVTRGGDDYAIFEGGQPPWWNPNEGTIFVEGRPQFYYAAGFVDLFNNGWFEIENNQPPFDVQMRQLTSPSEITVSNALSPFTTHKMAATFRSGDSYSLSVDGNGTTENDDPNYFLGTQKISFSTSDPFLFNKITYYPRALPESTLNRITS